MSLGAYRGGPQTGGLSKHNTSSLVLNPSRYFAGADGRLYCDIPPQQGSPVPLRGVRVFIGGGTPEQFTQMARPTSTDGTAVAALPSVLVFFAGFERLPIALAECGPAVTQNAAAVVTGDIRDTAVPVTSTVAKNGGTLETLDNTGRKTVDLRSATDPVLGVQLPPAGRLIVSRDGSFTGRLVLKGQILSYLDALTAKLNILAAYVTALQGSVFPPPTAPTVTFPDANTYSLGAAVLPVAPDAE